MIAAGWSDPEVALAVRANLQGWHDLPTGLAEEAAQRFGGLGPFTAAEVAALVGTAFLGSEALILLGHEGATVPLQQAAEGHHTAVDWRTEGPLRVELSGWGAT